MNRCSAGTLSVLLLLATTGCSSEDPVLAPSGSGGSGGVAGSAGNAGSSGSSGVSGSPGDAGTDSDPCESPCGNECCADEESCVEDHCRVPGLSCSTDDECANDSFCAPSLDQCVPYFDGENNETCELQVEPGFFRVTLQCAWTPPAEHADKAAVSAMPLVAKFGGKSTASIVAVTAPATPAENAGVIRVIDGTTCATEHTLDDVLLRRDSTPALGDINGDGYTDIVAHAQDGTLIAWAWQTSTQGFELLWHSTDASATKVHSLALADLDDDEDVEVIAGGLVFDHEGNLVASTGSQGDSLCTTGAYAAPTVIADVDLDGSLELVFSGSVWSWDGASGGLVKESYFTGSGADGFAAVGDFGEFPGVEGDEPGRPEVAVMSFGWFRLQTIAGHPVFGPTSLPGGGDGGNVTIADYDGDGEPEVGVVGLTRYVVYDPACGDASRPGVCATGRDDGILWEQPIDENSCAIMGSTVFDFEGDGAAEAVYADECYVRVFRGVDGVVVWSHPRPSASWYEAPVVADVDGDGRGEMVVPAQSYAGGGCPSPDPIFAGLRCDTSADCPPASSGCDAGFCRCVEASDCGDPDMTCTAPIAGTPGAGNVCRSVWSVWDGIRVYADDAHWAGSRAIWNQHAYSVTNIEEDGTVPRGSLVQRNWQTPGLNNFRQNTQEDLGSQPVADVTTTGTGQGQDCDAANPVLPLHFDVCNRGTLSAPAGIAISVYDGDPSQGGTLVCELETTGVIMPGTCESMTCVYDDPPIATPLEIHVVADTADGVDECLEGNNLGVFEAQCPPPNTPK